MWERIDLYNIVCDFISSNLCFKENLKGDAILRYYSFIMRHNFMVHYTGIVFVSQLFNIKAIYMYEFNEMYEGIQHIGW